VSKKRTSLQRFRLKRDLEKLGSKEGRGTELVSLYVPPGRQISEAVAMLNNEYGTAGNIKSTTTRKNVQDAIVKVTQRLKLFKQVPENGLVIFCGAIPQNGPGSEKIETYVIVPPEPIQVYLYRCDAKFHTQYLQEFLKEKETYGIIVLDASGATYATLRGKRLDIVEKITSGVPGKFRAGGQSARRFDRQREAKMQEYLKRVGEHSNKTFLEIENLKGLILGGPGFTKFDFEKGNYLHYTLKEKLIATIDTSYVGEQGVEEVVERSHEVLRRIRYVEARPPRSLTETDIKEVYHSAESQSIYKIAEGPTQDHPQRDLHEGRGFACKEKHHNQHDRGDDGEQGEIGAGALHYTEHSPGVTYVGQPEEIPQNRHTIV